MNQEDMKKEADPVKETEKEAEEFVKADDEAVENEQKEAKAEETNTEAKAETKKEKKDKHKEEILKLQNEINTLKNEKAKMADEYLRARADLENSRKRMKEENEVFKKYASEKLVESLLNPVDMLVKVCNVEQQNPEVNNFLIGFKMIAGQLQSALEADGLKKIDALNKPFDSKYHHAIGKEHKDGVEPDMVIEVLQDGYTYKDRLIRPAMVKISE